jgi:serine/threonine-protein kinase
MQVGQALGPFVIKDAIGRGGTSTVYRAVQPALDRVVALKVLRVDVSSDPTLLERFTAEARAAGSSEHRADLRRRRG